VPGFLVSMVKLVHESAYDLELFPSNDKGRQIENPEVTRSG
jgi:hypothetical protein